MEGELNLIRPPGPYGNPWEGVLEAITKPSNVSIKDPLPTPTENSSSTCRDGELQRRQKFITRERAVEEWGMGSSWLLVFCLVQGDDS